MPYNSSYVYSPPSPEYPAVAGTIIRAANFNTIINDISDALTQVFADLTDPDEGLGLVQYQEHTLASKLGEVVSLKDFGAIGDGVANDTAAIIDAMESVAVSGKALYIPPGNYLCAAKVIIDADLNMCIYGAGPGISNIVFTNSSSAGFDISVPYGQASPSRAENNFRGFSLLAGWTGNVCSNTALKVTRAEGSGGYVVPYEVLITDICIDTIRTVPIANCWLNGIHLYRPTDISTSGGGLQALISNCGIVGRVHNAATAGSGIILDTAVGCCIQQVSIFWMKKAIDIIGYTEGPLISNSSIVACYWGIYAETEAAQPSLTVCGSHLNCFKGGVYAKDRNHLIFSSNLVYQRPESLETPYYDILLETSAATLCSGISITNNIFFGSSKITTPANTVYGIGLLGQYTGIVIQGNILRNRNDNAIIIGADITGLVMYGNNTDNGVVNNAPVPSNLNFIASDRAISTSELIYKLLTNQIIPNATDTVVSSLDTTTRINNGAGGISGSTGKFIPTGDGHKVRFNATITFTSNATGFRRVSLFKNAATAMELPTITANAVSGAATALNLISPPIEYVSGDEFTIVVHQTSGGNLSLVADETYISMEIVA